MSESQGQYPIRVQGVHTAGAVVWTANRRGNNATIR